MTGSLTILRVPVQTVAPGQTTTPDLIPALVWWWGRLYGYIQRKAETSQYPQETRVLEALRAHRKTRVTAILHHIASTDNVPNPDKLDRKKKKSDRKETPSKSHSQGGHPGECTHDRAIHRLGEELVQKYADEDKERKSCSKKPKKGSSSQKETSVTRDLSKENKHKRKKKKREKKAKAQEAELQVERERVWEDELQAEREREDQEICWEKLLDQLRREKYSQECPELSTNRRKHIELEQMESVNLDDNMAYLTMIWKDTSQYPQQNVMSYARLLKQLKDHGRQEKANRMRVAIEKGLNSHAPTHTLSKNAPIIKPKYFIRVIQKKNGDVIDWHDGKYSEDQNIGLHDLVSQMSMCGVNVKQNITMNGHTYLNEVDAGFCPFCNYHCSCHKTLNNHVQLHLWLLM